MHAKPRLTEEQVDKTYTAYWLLKDTNEAAKYAGVSTATVVNLWRNYMLKAYYRDKPVPADLFFNTISEYFSMPPAAGIPKESKLYSRIIRKNSLGKKRISERMGVLEEVILYKKSVEPNELTQ